MNTVSISYTLHDSPIGKILLAGTPQGIQHIAFNSKSPGQTPSKSANNTTSSASNAPRAKNAKLPEDTWLKNAQPFSNACKQLDEYFAGTRTTFNLSLAPIGTEFQQQVWQQLLQIPFGDTCSYSDIANRLDNPKASRAVGAANGANPLPIVVPCHRVIGANGKLTGFSGGLAIKDWLLAHERGEPTLFSFEELQNSNT